MILNPYKTTIGTVIETNDLSKILNKFLVETTDIYLSYEYKSNNSMKYVFITGKNEYEIEIPVFNHPIHITDTVRGNDYIFIDIRQFVNVKGNTHFTKISEIIRDKSNFNILLVRAIYMDILHFDPSYIHTYTEATVGGMVAMLTNTLNIALVLNTVEQLEVSIAITHYFLSMLDVEKDNVPIRIARVSMVKDMDYIRGITDKLDDPINIDTLANNITLCSNSSKLLNVNSDLILNLIRPMFYCNNSSELLIMSLEHPPTMISLMYNAYDDRSYKRTKLTSILLNNKKRIPLDMFVKRVTNEIKDRMII